MNKFVLNSEVPSSKNVEIDYMTEVLQLMKNDNSRPCIISAIWRELEETHSVTSFDSDSSSAHSCNCQPVAGQHQDVLIQQLKESMFRQALEVTTTHNNLTKDFSDFLEDLKKKENEIERIRKKFETDKIRFDFTQLDTSRVSAASEQHQHVEELKDLLFRQTFEAETMRNNLLNDLDEFIIGLKRKENGIRQLRKRLETESIEIHQFQVDRLHMQDLLEKMESFKEHLIKIHVMKMRINGEIISDTYEVSSLSSAAESADDGVSGIIGSVHDKKGDKVNTSCSEQQKEVNFILPEDEECKTIATDAIESIDQSDDVPSSCNMLYVNPSSDPCLNTLNINEEPKGVKQKFAAFRSVSLRLLRSSGRSLQVVIDRALSKSRARYNRMSFSHNL